MSSPKEDNSPPVEKNETDKTEASFPDGEPQPSIDTETKDDVLKKADCDKEESDKEVSDNEDSDKEEGVKELSNNDTVKKEKNEKHDNEKISDKEESEKDEDEKEESEEEKEKNEKISHKEKSEKDEEEKEESEEEKQMGLLDRPVEVTGCRARKQVARLQVSFVLPTKDMQIPEGRGQKLGDIPIIEFQIAKHSVADLKALHRVLFKRQGTDKDTKKNIRKFSGFPFQENSPEFEQKKANVEKFQLPVLKGICEVLDIERNGTKEDIVMRMLQFLVCPSDSGKALPKKKSSGRDKKSATKKKGKADSKKSKAKSSEEEGDDEIAPSADEASDASANEEEKETSDSETKKKSKPKSKKTPIKVKTVKKEKPKKEAKGLKRKKENASDSSDESEPAAKKTKPPDDDDIKQLVKTILEQADLHEITMKKVIKQVYDTYPDCDLTDKKSFIKKTIKTGTQFMQKLSPYIINQQHPL